MKSGSTHGNPNTLGIDTIEKAVQDGSLPTIWSDQGLESIAWPVESSSCELLSKVVVALRLAGKYAAAVRAADQLRTIGLQLHDERFIAEASVLRGRCFRDLGETGKAALAYMDAMAAFARCDDHDRYCRALLQLSYVEQTKGHLLTAADYAIDAGLISHEHSLPFTAACSRQYLGLHRTLAGKLRLAVSVLVEAVADFHKLDHRLDEARTLLSLAFAETLAEKFTDATAHLKQARELLKGQNTVRDLAICDEYEAALYLKQGKLDLAEKAIKACVKTSLEEFPDGDMTSQAYRLWAEIDIKRGDHEAAMQHATDGLGVARRVGERIEIGAIERILGQAADVRKDSKEAQKHLSEAISILSDCGANYELSLAYQAAGQAQCFDRKARLDYLYSALALFREMETAGLEKEAQSIIRTFTSPVPAEGAEHSTTIVAQSKAMRDILSRIDHIKDLNDSILIEGETGVGKDILAAYVHYSSRRASKPFVLFNSAAVPEALAESELFGHARGAFSGAMRDREGLLFAAKEGTFFFNEISEATPSFQAKLLSVIETRRVRPVGCNEERPIHARLIFATNRDLEREVKEGRFRKDLFYRLSNMRVTVPPLRSRPEDVLPLLETFLTRHGLSETQLVSLRKAPEWNALPSGSWEGNARELEILARRLAVEVTQNGRDILEILESCVEDIQSANETVKIRLDRDSLIEVLRKHHGNKRRAAAELGIAESTLRWRVDRLGLENYI